MDKELIKAAAIKITDKFSETIYIGKSHSDIIKNNEFGICKNGIQGFTTSFGRFVDRKEAKIIVIQSKQLDHFIGTLYSEYFWGKNGKYDYDEKKGYISR